MDRSNLDRSNFTLFFHDNGPMTIRTIIRIKEIIITIGYLFLDDYKPEKFT